MGFERRSRLHWARVHFPPVNDRQAGIAEGRRRAKGRSTKLANAYTSEVLLWNVA